MNKHRIMALVVLSVCLLTSLSAEAAEYRATYAPAAISSLAVLQTTTLPVTVTNTGTVTWLSTGANPIRLSYHWYAAGAAPTSTPPNYGAAVWNGFRTDLPGPLAPGTSVTLNATIIAPSSAGTYTLKWDMLREYVSYFSQLGVPTKDQTVTVVLRPVAEPPTLAPVPAGYDPSGWPQDRGDAAKTGWHLWSWPEPKGVVAWSLPVGRMIDSSPVVAPGTGTIYVGTADAMRALVAINPNGTQKWATSLGDFKVRAAPAIRSDGSLVVVSYQDIPTDQGWAARGRVQFISASGGLLSISPYAFYNKELSSPLLDRDDNAYVFYRKPGSNEVLIKFDRNFASNEVGGIHYDITGAGPLLPSLPDPPSWWPWSFKSAPVSPGPDPPVPPPVPSPAPTSFGSIILPSYKTASIIPGVGRDSRTVWVKDIPAMATAAAHSYVSRAYIVTAHKRVEAWTDSGNKEWEGQLGGYPVAPPALGHSPLDSSPRLVYVAASDGYLYTFNRAATCSSPVPDSPCVWRRKIGTQFAGAPAVLGIGGGQEIVVVASDAKVLRAFRWDGTPLWSVPLDSPAYGSPAIVNGTIYVATQTSIYAIK